MKERGYNILSRMFHLFDRKVNSWMNHFEDPLEIVDVAYQRHEVLLGKAKYGLVTIVAAKKRLEMHISMLEAQNAKLEREAEGCINAQREDLAKLVLQKKIRIHEDLESAKKQYSYIRMQEEQMTDTTRKLQSVTEHLRLKKDTLKAQYVAAKAMLEVQKVMSGLSTEVNSLSEAIKKLQGRTEEMQSMSGAIEDVASEGLLREELQETILDAHISEMDPRIDNELERIKEKKKKKPSEQESQEDTQEEEIAVEA